MRVRALRDLNYNARDYRAGEEFETLDEMHGMLLVHAKSAEEIAEGKKRGQYRRRDMRADE